MNKISERIRSSRHKANLTQKELANMAGVSRVTVTQWENGHIEHIRPENLFPAAKALNVTPEWLALGQETHDDTPAKHGTLASRTVEALRQALPYIHIHQGKTFVIHLPDEAVFSSTFHGIVHDLTLLSSLGTQIVLVHGARRTIQQTLSTTSIGHTLTHGLRITPKTMLPIIQQAVGAVKLEIEAHFSMGAANTPMSHAHVRIVSGNLITAQPIGIVDGVDFEYSGKVRGLDENSIKQYLAQQHLVLLSPVGYSSTGEIFNLSSTALAQTSAITLQADKLIYLTEAFDETLTPTLPVHLSLHEAATSHSHPALKYLLPACKQGVHRGHILDYNADGALLTETLTRDGSGLMVTADRYENIRTATLHDIPGIMEILTPLEQQEILVPRSQKRLEQDIQHFHVIEKDGMILGNAALYPYPLEGRAELACLAIHRAYQRLGYGELLLQHIEQQALAEHLDSLFVLTTQSMQWFLERGFTQGSIKELPHDRQNLYNWQRNSRVMLKQLKRSG